MSTEEVLQALTRYTKETNDSERQTATKLGVNCMTLSTWLHGNDVVIKGSIRFANEFIFDGNLEGDITSADGVLTVGENAHVRGDVKSKIVIVKGKMHGNITVPERCELHA